MTELLTAAQMRAIEQAAIDSGQVTGLELMERAGRGVVEAVFEEWPELAKGPHRAVVLCGPGNNGGDGFVVARLLKDWGWEVEVFLFGDAGKLPPDALTNYEAWLERGLVRPSEALGQHSVFECDLFVDALFGTGLSRPIGSGEDALDGPYEFAWDYYSEQHARIVSIDCESGRCSDSGRTLGRVFPSHLTVTFHRAKHAAFLGDQTGARIRIVDIGIEAFARESAGPTVRLTSRAVAAAAAFRENGHKFIHGHALILSGGADQTGAARLAARGALRIGAGLVTLGTPPEAQAEAAAQLTAIMLKPVGDATAFAEMLKDARINALCLGPALGLTGDKSALIETALKAQRPTVLDADALTLIAAEPALFALLHDTCVLTPHHGEFRRLFPDIAEKLDAPAIKGPAYSKVDATRDAAVRAGCTVLYKGPDTVIASADGTCAINSSAYDRAAPWLATAGSGDVLAGFITGLLARSFNPQQAAETGAWLHTECALSFGPGLIAEDIPEELPKVLHALID